MAGGIETGHSAAGSRGEGEEDAARQARGFFARVRWGAFFAHGGSDPSLRVRSFAIECGGEYYTSDDFPEKG